jgi:two-component system, OmpR family, sensor histidine kinase SaeS
MPARSLPTAPQHTARPATDRPQPLLIGQELVAEVAHEMGTPLYSVDTTVGLLLSCYDSLDRDEATELLRRVHHGTRWLQELLASLTETPLGAAGRADFAPGPVDLERSVHDAVPLVQPLLDRKGQRVAVQADAEAPAAWGDAQLIRRVLINLLTNAAKYGAPEDQIRVRLEGDDQWVRVRVTDHGRGIRRADQARIFAPYVRAGAPAEPGAGLGLNLVKSLVELHGGHVGVHSRYRRGSTFWFALPRAHPPAKKKARRSPRRAANTPQVA